MEALLVKEVNAKKDDIRERSKKHPHFDFDPNSPKD
jgi:hypothetical protein